MKTKRTIAKPAAAKRWMRIRLNFGGRFRADTHPISVKIPAIETEQSCHVRKSLILEMILTHLFAHRNVNKRLQEIVSFRKFKAIQFSKNESALIFLRRAGRNTLLNKGLCECEQVAASPKSFFLRKGHPHLLLQIPYFAARVFHASNAFQTSAR